jgi:hypothetical protein
LLLCQAAQLTGGKPWIGDTDLFGHGAGLKALKVLLKHIELCTDTYFSEARSVREMRRAAKAYEACAERLHFIPCQDELLHFAHTPEYFSEELTYGVTLYEADEVSLCFLGRGPAHAEGG